LLHEAVDILKSCSPPLKMSRCRRKISLADITDAWVMQLSAKQ
jgi:hypothetical protein